MQQVLAQLRVENQQRNQDGEARCEQLRNDIAKDECAHALPDARFTDRLRRHAERATASAVSPAYTADADHTGNADKRAIELLEQRRLQRLNNEDNNHAEN